MKRINIQIPDELLAEFDRLGKRFGMTRTAYIRSLILTELYRISIENPEYKVTLPAGFMQRLGIFAHEIIMKGNIKPKKLT